MADITMEIGNTLDVEIGATPQQLLPLIETNNSLATSNKALAESNKTLAETCQDQSATAEELTANNAELVATNKSLSEINGRLSNDILAALNNGLQTKEVAPTVIEQVIKADEGYLGLLKVTIAAAEREVEIINRRGNDCVHCYYMEDIAATYQRSDYAACIAGEFSKSMTYLTLSGADAYLTSDGDFYSAKTIHLWHDDDDMHSNRWVVYYFAEGNNSSDFIIEDATNCPTTLAVRGQLGAIIADTSVPIKEINIADDSSVLDLRFANTTQFNTKTRIGNIKRHTSGSIVGNACETVESDIEEATTQIFSKAVNNMYFPKLKSAYYINNIANESLSNIYIPELVECDFIVSTSNKLRKIDAPKLKNVFSNKEYSTFICGEYLTEVNLPVFEGIDGGLYYRAVFSNTKSLEEINLPVFKGVRGYHSTVVSGATKLKKLILPHCDIGSYCNIFAGCNALEYVYVPECTYIQNEEYNGNSTSNMPKLHTYIIGKFGYGRYTNTLCNAFLNCPRLVHLEATMEQNIDVQLPKWEPTEALTDGTDLIEDSSRCFTNKQQFFVNFIEYILHKLKNRTGYNTKLTLTLSEIVYDAIFSDDSGYTYGGQLIADYVTSYITGINWEIAKAE